MLIKTLCKMEVMSKLALQRFYSIIYFRNSSSLFSSQLFPSPSCPPPRKTPRRITVKDAIGSSAGEQGFSQAQRRGWSTAWLCVKWSLWFSYLEIISSGWLVKHQSLDWLSLPLWRCPHPPQEDRRMRWPALLLCKSSGIRDSYSLLSLQER